MRTNFQLLWNLIKRDIASRFKGSVLGFLWFLITPFFTLAIYYYIFTVIFKARWNLPMADAKGEAPVALILFCGLICFNFFSECFTRGSTLMRENPNYIKKVVFPLWIMPCVAYSSAMFTFAINLGLLLLFYLAVAGIPPLSVMVIPVILLPFFLFLLGLTYGISSLGVYVPDIRQIVPTLNMALMFLTPIFYPISAVPGYYQEIIALNPLAATVEQMRGALFAGTLPTLASWLPFFVVSLLVFVLGYLFFKKTSKGFADVL